MQFGGPRRAGLPIRVTIPVEILASSDQLASASPFDGVLNKLSRVFRKIEERNPKADAGVDIGDSRSDREI